MISTIFETKIKLIMEKQRPTKPGETNNDFIKHNYLTDLRFYDFREVTPEEVKMTVKKAPSKSCKSDPIPTTLLKDYLDTLLSSLTLIINESLEHGDFSSELKEALLHPLLKKSGLELIFKYFRRDLNLSFLSKLIKCLVCSQPTEMAESSGNVERLQSAYHPGHSTETALLRVKADLLEDMNKGQVNVLIMLDLSEAFNTVNHELLLNLLHFRFGFEGNIQKWI